MYRKFKFKCFLYFQWQSSVLTHCTVWSSKISYKEHEAKGLLSH